MTKTPVPEAAPKRYNPVYNQLLQGVPADLRDLVRRLRDLEDAAKWLSLGQHNEDHGTDQWWNRRRAIDRAAERLTKPGTPRKEPEESWLSRRRLINDAGTTETDGNWVEIDDTRYTQHETDAFWKHFRSYGIRYFELQMSGERMVSTVTGRDELLMVLEADGVGRQQYYVLGEMAHPRIEPTGPFGVFRWIKDQRNHEYSGAEHGPAVKVWLNQDAQTTLYQLLARH